MLPPPAKDLTHALMRKGETTAVTIGGALFTKTCWPACSDGCCEAGTTYQIRVPCDNVPHCNACECGTEHIVSLSETDLRAIKGLLP